MKNESSTVESSRRTASGSVLPMDECPVCHYEFDSATLVHGDGRPSPGNFTLCMKCGEILIFDEHLKVQPPSVSQLMNLSPGLSRILDRAQRLIRKERVKG
jgi:hypothetical protein